MCYNIQCMNCMAHRSSWLGLCVCIYHLSFRVLNTYKGYWHRVGWEENRVRVEELAMTDQEVQDRVRGVSRESQLHPVCGGHLKFPPTSQTTSLEENGHVRLRVDQTPHLGLQCLCMPMNHGELLLRCNRGRHDRLHDKWFRTDQSITRISSRAGKL